MSKIAVINAGSSSLKFKLFDMSTYEVLKSVLIEHIGEKESKFRNHHDALESIDIDFTSLSAIGHRVVHGGESFHGATLVTKDVLDEIKKLSILAPLHNPASLEGISVAMKKAANIPQITVFDTSFHATMPEEAYLYALRYEMYQNHDIRRYGFHGISHSYVTKKASELLKIDVNKINLITLHLGNGASACAIENGKSIDTSMGLTPLEGLVMGSRAGDIDPAIVLYMQRELNMTIDEVDNELNKKSGLVGICGDNDVRSILESEDKYAKLALKMMVRRIQKYIGSYMAILGRVDGVIFTGGIGENSSYIRDKVMESEFLSSLKILVIKTDEEFEIATQCVKILDKGE